MNTMLNVGSTNPKTRERIRQVTHEVLVSRPVVKEGSPKKSTTKEKEVSPMKQVEVTSEFERAEILFANKIASDRQAVLDEEGREEFQATVDIEPGRRYDKIYTGTRKGGVKASSELFLFVERVTGKIFLPKSENQPNENRFYSTISHADKWNWGSDIPVNLGDTTVKEAGKYSGLTHWIPVDETKAPRKNARKEPVAKKTPANGRRGRKAGLKISLKPDDAALFNGESDLNDALAEVIAKRKAEMAKAEENTETQATETPEPMVATA